ncbi:MAG: TIGR04255 family protein [Peptococcaceae bacterium]|jgi:uncharacterized protein (TIGR04255 family)|nr:TIGR04255 family protein [Peptococcaceae bacterium]
MPFSDFQRVIYKKNPLIEVVCQLRFPRILMINEKQPAAFQERIRDDYPLFQVAVEQQQQITMDIGGNEIPPAPRIFQSETINNYKFSSADEKWHINLTSTFLALSTSAYDRWENFQEHLQKPLDALLEIYRPAFFERIGLRYVDAFKKSALNLNDAAWPELIQPFVLGFMSNSEISDDVRNQNAAVELDIGNGAIAQINAAKGFIGDATLGLPIFSDEESFIVDSDMYMLRKNIGELDASLTYLHDYARKLIRSIITEKLHDAMEPSELSEL